MERLKFFIIFLILAFSTSPSFAARQVLNESASPSSKGTLNTNFSNANKNFVELYAADLLKADASCFASESAFNSCFALDWAAGGGATVINDLTDVDTTGKATGKILKFDASGNLVVGDDEIGAAGSGDITGVTAGTGLTGGGDTGAVTLGLSTTISDAITANTAKVTNATHTGDVTGSGALTIANNAVTLAKMADMATASVIYRKTANTGDPEVQTLATLKADLGLTGTNSGDQTTITGNAGTATALAANPTDCSAGQYATTIAANGNLTCAQVSYSQIGSTPTLGTAAALDHGTAIGNLVRLTDDGGGNPALPFSLYLTNALLGSSTSLPGTCTVGQTYYDLDADTDGELYVCRATNTWKAVDDDGAAGITASSTDTFTNKTIDTAATGNAITVPLNGVLDGAITDPADADDMIYKKVQNAMTLTDIHCLAEGGGTITLTLQECTASGASCANIEGAITCDADGAEDDGTLTDGAIAAGAWLKVLYSAPTGIVNNVAWTVFGTQTW